MGAPFIYPLISSGFVLVRNSTSFARIPLARSSLSSLPAFSRTPCFRQDRASRFPVHPHPSSAPTPREPAFSHTFSQPGPRILRTPAPFSSTPTPRGPRIFIHLFAARPPNTPNIRTLSPAPNTPGASHFHTLFPQPDPRILRSFLPRILRSAPRPLGQPLRSTRPASDFPTPRPQRFPTNRLPFHSTDPGSVPNLLFPTFPRTRLRCSPPPTGTRRHPAGSRYETPPEILRPPFPPRPPTEKGVPTST